MLSLRIEAIMDERRPENPVNWDQTDEDILYGQALKAALAEGPLWAEGNIRIGDYILLLDSDTRVPVDCLIDGASEMEQCPEVGILQHCNGTFLAGAGVFLFCAPLICFCFFFLEKKFLLMFLNVFKAISRGASLSSPESLILAFRGVLATVTWHLSWVTGLSFAGPPFSNRATSIVRMGWRRYGVKTTSARTLWPACVC